MAGATRSGSRASPGRPSRPSYTVLLGTKWDDEAHQCTLIQEQNVLDGMKSESYLIGHEDFAYSASCMCSVVRFGKSTGGSSDAL